MNLIAQTDTGKTPDFAVPNIRIIPVFADKIGQLAVIFEIKNSPEEAFYPSFATNNEDKIAQLQQDFLWQHSCYELFLAFDNAKDSPYLEINVSPSGAFNLYHFDGYRTPQQMPPRRLTITANQRQSLLNFYRVSHDNSPIVWQNSLSDYLNLTQLIEKNYPLQAENHRLVMVLDIKKLTEILQINQAKVMERIWLNPCAVFKGAQGLVYFAHQHASPPDFHNKNYWIETG